VSGFLRFINIINAAIWFGAGIFFTLGILPAVFSHDLHALFGESGYPYFSGAVALILFKRFFALQYICGGVALFLLLAEKFYTGRKLPSVGTTLVLVMFGFGLIGGLWLQPKMQTLRGTMYSSQPIEVREKARHSFGIWHGTSLLANFVVLGGLLAHLVRVTRPPEQSRYGTFYQIP
jgi:hypothetical protein